MSAKDFLGSSQLKLIVSGKASLAVGANPTFTATGARVGDMVIVSPLSSTTAANLSLKTNSIVSAEDTVTFGETVATNPLVIAYVVFRT